MRQHRLEISHRGLIGIVKPIHPFPFIIILTIFDNSDIGFPGEVLYRFDKGKLFMFHEKSNRGAAFPAAETMEDLFVGGDRKGR